MKKTLALYGVLLLSACAVGPKYHRPAMNIPAAYEEGNGAWQPARPMPFDHGAWWRVYDDPVLDALEKQVAVSNQTLKADAAAYREALATVQTAQAGFFPNVSLNGAGTRARTHTSTGNAVDLSASASWAPDIWGKIRDAVAEERANAEASKADLAAATLSEQAALATDYFQLRATDRLESILLRIIRADARNGHIVINQYKAGTVSRAAVLQARLTLAAATAQYVSAKAQRKQLQHALAVLVGRAPADFSLMPEGGLPLMPAIPSSLPSILLQRRPDIVAAERRVAAANAAIGVAQTAYFPDLTLSASGGASASAVAQLMRTGSEVWSLGPAMALTVFDGGARNAAVRNARAAYDQKASLYRETVLTAFQQVEDGLSTLRLLAMQEKIENYSADTAKAAQKIALNQYDAGTVAYTGVITAETQALAAEQAVLTVRENCLVASVQLIAALGGGWDGQN